MFGCVGAEGGREVWMVGDRGGVLAVGGEGVGGDVLFRLKSFVRVMSFQGS